jgi:hypothetical protein
MAGARAEREAARARERRALLALASREGFDPETCALEWRKESRATRATRRGGGDGKAHIGGAAAGAPSGVLEPRFKGWAKRAARLKRLPLIAALTITLEQMRRQGKASFARSRRIFAAFDARGEGLIFPEQAEAALHLLRASLSGEEIATIVAALPRRRRSGKVPYVAFLRLVHDADPALAVRYDVDCDKHYGATTASVRDLYRPHGPAPPGAYEPKMPYEAAGYEAAGRRCAAAPCRTSIVLRFVPFAKNLCCRLPPFPSPPRFPGFFVIVFVLVLVCAIVCARCVCVGVRVLVAEDTL